MVVKLMKFSTTSFQIILSDSDVKLVEFNSYPKTVLGFQSAQNYPVDTGTIPSSKQICI
jgi:hypothetical protein